MEYGLSISGMQLTVSLQRGEPATILSDVQHLEKAGLIVLGTFEEVFTIWTSTTRAPQEEWWPRKIGILYRMTNTASTYLVFIQPIPGPTQFQNQFSFRCRASEVDSGTSVISTNDPFADFTSVIVNGFNCPRFGFVWELLEVTVTGWERYISYLKNKLAAVPSMTTFM